MRERERLLGACIHLGGCQLRIPHANFCRETRQSVSGRRSYPVLPERATFMRTWRQRERWSARAGSRRRIASCVVVRIRHLACSVVNSPPSHRSAVKSRSYSIRIDVELPVRGLGLTIRNLSLFGRREKSVFRFVPVNYPPSHRSAVTSRSYMISLQYGSLGGRVVREQNDLVHIRAAILPCAQVTMRSSEAMRRKDGGRRRIETRTVGLR